MKAIKWIVKFLYKYSGAEWVVFEISVRVSAYRVRLNIVPVSYKLFLVLVGVAIGSGYMYVYQNRAVVWSFENTSAPVIIETAHAAPVSVAIKAVPTIEELADLIHLRESTKGKKNYSQCEKIGKFNEYGFGIPGDGSFLCFDKGMDRVAVLGWLAQKRASGMSDSAMLCLYSGSNYKECKK